MTYIVVEGNIGSGKSTLVKWLAQKTGWESRNEIDDDDPVLTEFYKDPVRNAFTMQMYMMNLREVDHMYASSSKKPVIMDRSIFGGDVFASVHHAAGNITPTAWGVYCSLFHAAIERLSSANALDFAMVYLEVDPEVAYKRVQNRNRSVESTLSQSYLYALDAEYAKKLGEWRGIQVINLPWNGDYRDLNDSPAVDLLADLKRLTR